MLGINSRYDSSDTMPRQRRLTSHTSTLGTVRPAPVQLPLFAERVALVRLCPEQKDHRFYNLAVWSDLFGRAVLLRHWGRFGTRGWRRLDPHPDLGAALNALADRVRAKRRHGYQEKAA